MLLLYIGYCDHSQWQGSRFWYHTKYCCYAEKLRCMANVYRYIPIDFKLTSLLHDPQSFSGIEQFFRWSWNSCHCKGLEIL